MLFFLLGYHCYLAGKNPDESEFNESNKSKFKYDEGIVKNLWEFCGKSLLWWVPMGRI